MLVTEGEQRGALAACRAMASAGYEVAAVAGRRPAASHWSRACAGSLLIADPSDSAQRFSAALAAVVRDGSFEAVLPGGERSLLCISEQRDALSPHAELGLPDHDAVQSSLDKLALLDGAAAAGLDPPPSKVCENRAEGNRAAGELGLPVVVKPRRSVLPSADGLRQQPVALVTRRPALQAALAGWAPPYIVQRFDDRAGRLSCGGLMTGEGILGFVVVRFLRTWPVEAGAVCFGETVATPAGLVPRVENLLARLGWRGIFELELLELGHGRFGAIDLNPRVFGWLALAVASGVNLPVLWLDWAAGRDPQPVAPRLGLRYRWEDAELAHLVWQLRRGHLRAAAQIALPRRHVVHAHFRLRDPAPLLARLLELARHRRRGAIRGGFRRGR